MVVIVLIAVLVSLDLISKHIIRQKMNLQEMKPIYGQVLFFRRIENKGSFLGLWKENVRMLYMMITATLLYMLRLFYHAFRRGEKTDMFALSFIMAGGLANMIDRIKHGSVTDFLYIKYKKMPVFNVADIFVFLGFIIMFIHTLFDFRQNKQ